MPTGRRSSRKREEAIFLPRAEQPHAEEIAVGERVQRLDELIPFVLWRRPRIEKRAQALQAVRRGEDERGHGEQDGTAEDRHVFPRRAAQKDHAEHERTHAHRHRHIRFEHDEHADRQPSTEQRQDAAEAPDARGIFRHISRREHHIREFCQFRRLYGERADADPARRPIIALPHARHEDEREQDERKSERGQPELSQPTVIEQPRPHHRAQPEEKPDELFFEEIERIPVLHFRVVTARRIHADDAVSREKDDADEQRDVAFSARG